MRRGRRGPRTTGSRAGRVRRVPGPRAGAPLLIVSLAVALSACGGGDDEQSEPSLPPGFEAAAEVSRADFPAAQGRTLQELADTIPPGPQLGLASSVLVSGRNRLAFGLLNADNSFLYGASTVYLARTPTEAARGPFPAPIDSMVPDEAYLSNTTATDPVAPNAIYAADVPLPRPGRYGILVVTQRGEELVDATARIRVERSSPIPAVGERPPAIETPTVDSVGGKIRKIETRDPPDEMHEVSFADVLGRRPVALLFATPALCQSRTCGPVTDLAAQLQADYGERMAFIHNEIYVGNDPNKGLRPQLGAFGLDTEPWLFTIDGEGRVAARLAGAFGIDAFRRAVEAALR